MRRLFPLVLLLAGCGGHGGSSANAPMLGASALDLALAGGNSEATAMVGTGRTPGSLSIVTANDSLAQATTAEVSASLSSAYVDGRRLMQSLRIELEKPATLSAGTSFALDGAANFLEYDELPQFEGGASTGNVGGLAWKATGGTATVVSRSGAAIVLSLSGVSLVSDNVAGGLPLTLSGMIAGTVQPGLDL